MSNASVFVQAHEEMLKSLIIGDPLMNISTPSQAVRTAQGEYIPQSIMNYFGGLDAFADVGFTGIMWPITTLYKWIDSYIVPREVLPSDVDYRMPEYTSPGERKSLYGDIEPKYSQRRLERKYYKYVDRLLKDLEKMNKKAKKYISKGMEKKLKEIEKELEKYENDYVIQGLMG